MNATSNNPDGIAPIFMAEVDVVGVSAIGCFYVLMLVIGAWATWHQYKQKSNDGNFGSEELLLAGRRLGLPIAVATLSATQVGGAFLVGTAEETFKNGILWCGVPFAYIAGVIINGVTFAKKMRNHGYVTVFDPLQESYGSIMGGLCVVPHIIGDVFWIGAVLSVLGSTLRVTMGVDKETSVLVSSAVGLIYTLSGGLLSIAYTDVFQLAVIFVGMFLSLSYVVTSEAVSLGGFGPVKDWLGHVPAEKAGAYVDGLLVPLLGGIPWQGYYQRALSLESPNHIIPMSFLSSILPLMLLVPPIVIGIVAKTAAWDMTELGTPINPDDASIVLPLALRYLVPKFVTFFGVGAVTAAVMSTMDSAVLGTSSAIANNLYKGLLRNKASDAEVTWCSRISVLVVGVVATGVAFAADSIYGLWYLSSDLTYVLVFPHFVMAMISPKLGTPLGSAASFIVGIALRILVGEASIGLPSVINFPETVPVRTLTMAVSAVVLICASVLDQAFKSSKRENATNYDLGNNCNSSGIFTMSTLNSSQSPRPSSKDQ